MWRWYEREAGFLLAGVGAYDCGVGTHVGLEGKSFGLPGVLSLGKAFEAEVERLKPGRVVGVGGAGEFGGICGWDGHWRSTCGEVVCLVAQVACGGGSRGND